MQIKNELKSILRTRHYLVIDESIRPEQNTNTSAYLNAYLLANFGVVVDKPAFLNRDLVQQIDEEFHLNVPKSFYSNPQDTKYFSCEELLIEQLVSYFAYGSDLGRIELFKKDLPEYVEGDELKLRTFYVINEQEASEVLTDILNSYCAYTRPFSIDELGEFCVLFEEGFYSGAEIKCKDNIFAVLNIDTSLLVSWIRKTL